MLKVDNNVLEVDGYLPNIILLLSAFSRFPETGVIAIVTVHYVFDQVNIVQFIVQTWGFFTIRILLHLHRCGVIH